MEPSYLAFPALAVRFFVTAPPGKPFLPQKKKENKTKCIPNLTTFHHLYLFLPVIITSGHLTGLPADILISG